MCDTWIGLVFALDERMSPSKKMFDFYSAAVLLAIQSAVIPTAIPSVRLSHAGIVRKRMKIGSRDLKHYFSDTNNDWEETSLST